MLSKPSAGWVNFTLQDFTFTASYLTDIPNDFINALTVALRDNISTTVNLDGEEDGECAIMFNTYHDTVSALAYPIGGENRVETVFWDENILSIAEKFVADIEENIDAWRWWGYDDEIKDIDLSELKEVIANYKASFA